ncbi:hypothetical protein GGI04_002383 [Coemansia thaxteri]|nr:hypothetical protein GGI04_002383 [Coemansia thaxteri]
MGARTGSDESGSNSNSGRSPRAARGFWHGKVQSRRLARRSNSALSPRIGTCQAVSRFGKDSSPTRRSLDSQRVEAARRAGEDGGDYACPRPMWSDEQLRRARRFSSSHTRGASCPTLNITRIMRSISVSAGYGSGASRMSSSSRQARWESAMPALLSPELHRHPHAPPDAAVLPALATIRSCSGEMGREPSIGLDSNSSTHDGGSSSQLRILVDSHAAVPSGLCAEGLRRRISVRQREIGTPDFLARGGAGSPLPCEEAPASPLNHQCPSSPSSPSAVPSIGSACSSARWSTISAESPHKRYSYSSAAIAEALHNLQSVARGDILGDCDSSSTSKGSGDESMTITLKAPRNLDAADAASNGDGGLGIQPANMDATPHDGGEFTAMSEIPSLRPSLDGSETAIPAVYLDGAASLWDQYVAELESSEFDPNIHLKRQRVSQFVRVPWHVEKLLWFGVAICFDALIYVFSILPAKFVRALLQLVVALLFELPALLEWACTSVYARAVVQALPAAWSARLVRTGRRAQRLIVRLSGRVGGHSEILDAGGNSVSPPEAAGLAASNSGTTIGGQVVRWLSPTQLFDFYRGLLLIITCALLCRIDAAQMYHSIRAQSSLKLYFIFSALDIFDRLLSSFGHDVMDALQSTVTDPRSKRWKSGATYFALAQIYMLIHTLVLFYQVITLNVAVNAYSDQLLALLISNQFVEIKSNVFKKWEKEMLFQVVCADVVERFQEIVFLFIIILRNLAELSGTGLPPLFASPLPLLSTVTSSAAAGATSTVVLTAQTPVSFDSATPSAFGPLLPAWISVPLVNRIITPVLMVLGTEILIDWIKHAFITKLNWIRPEIYSHYMDILSRDLACSKVGVRAKVIPPSSTLNSAPPPLAANTPVNEKPGGENDQPSPPAALAPRTSSIIAHAAFKALAWAQVNLFAEARGVPDAPQTNARRRGHQRAHSVTQPQLFVEQSTRVARRLGLSPMPLACLIMLMLMQVVHILVSSSASALLSRRHPDHNTGSQLMTMVAGWSLLDVLAWLIFGLIAYALVVWTKLAFANRLMHYAWIRYRAFERRTKPSADSGQEPPPLGLKHFDDSTKRLDCDSFMEVGKLIAKEKSESEWEKQRPKWTLDNIERYSLFKSRIP